MFSSRLSSISGRKCSILMAIIVLQYCSICPALPQSQPLSSADSFGRQYTELTKKILLAGIDLERFSLNFRMENTRESRLKNLRYFLSQEAGSACALAFEICGDDQFSKGRYHPLKLNKHVLHGALATAVTGSIIAASGSCLELSANLLQSINNRRNGYDYRSANKYVASKLKQFDELLAQREALVAAHPDDPASERAKIEGNVLRQLRSAFVNEYSHFNADTRSYLGFQNSFYFLNAAYNTVGALGAEYAFKAVNTPKLNGTAGVLFVISGGMATVAPLLCSAVVKIVRKQSYDSVASALKEKPNFDAAGYSTQCKRLEEAVPGAEGSLIPSLPATQRVALYMQSDDLFCKQLENETMTMRKLEKVALETTLLGPPIGGQLMSQGILSTVGYYRYKKQPRKTLNLSYYGSVVGTVGTSMAVVGNAAWLLSSLSYEHGLSKKKQLPVQLIKERLDHLADLEKTVSAL